MKRFILFLAIIISFGLFPLVTDAAALPEADSKHYTFAVIPYYTPEKIWKLFTPFVDYLNKTTGQSWKLQLYNNHEEFVEDMCNGKISIALAGPVPLGRAYNKCGVKPMLVALGKSGKPSYHSVLITNDPEVRSISDLKGRKIGLFKGSTAAHILPVKMLKSSGVRLSETKPVFLESQDRIVSALMAGELSAGGMKEALYQRLGKANLRVLATSEEVPNFALAALPSLPAKVREKVVAELRMIKPLANANHAELVKNWDDEVKNGFTEPGKDFLPSILNLYSVFWEVTNELR
ncbi:PhnD/SsuA/transferrin family substrate-binding protein [Geobacter pelophilus]|uniref:PhnD/SsuA/transferrin family substrate-binding protein n=1 Tax=Geoanaerobacter pelophilus TaxID=60036 RepID=A0AAW4L197_9BACT|nr:PhnD/SsuA/transferrin family substrate-binding protein [Geoanaerobacter pelophilus]MBT0664633.1 PhnD/SsuA/transferrin family substrate-binding protein [Geoanaerobacter pelophilus]